MDKLDYNNITFSLVSPTFASISHSKHLFAKTSQVNVRKHFKRLYRFFPFPEA